SFGVPQDDESADVQMSQTIQQSSTATASPIIHAEAINKRFRMGESVLPVLKGVDLSVRGGEFLAIEGRSGSGKSTLLHCLGALEAPDNGSVFFDGKNIAELAQQAKPLFHSISPTGALHRMFRIAGFTSLGLLHLLIDFW